MAAAAARCREAAGRHALTQTCRKRCRSAGRWWGGASSRHLTCACCRSGNSAVRCPAALVLRVSVTPCQLLIRKPGRRLPVGGEAAAAAGGPHLHPARTGPGRMPRQADVLLKRQRAAGSSVYGGLAGPPALGSPTLASCTFHLAGCCFTHSDWWQMFPFSALSSLSGRAAAALAACKQLRCAATAVLFKRRVPNHSVQGSWHLSIQSDRTVGSHV